MTRPGRANPVCAAASSALTEGLELKPVVGCAGGASLDGVRGRLER